MENPVETVNYTADVSTDTEHSLRAEIDRLAALVDRKSQINLQLAFQWALKDPSNGTTCETLLRDHIGNSLDDRYYCLARFSVSGPVNAADEELLSILERMFHACNFQYADHVWAWLDGACCCLISVNKSSDLAAGTIMFSRMVKKYAEDYGHTLCIILSKWHEMSFKMHWYYVEAMDAYERTKHHRYPPGVLSQTSDFKRLPDMEHALSVAVSAHDFRKAASAFDTILSIYVDSMSLNPASSIFIVHARLMQVLGYLGFSLLPEVQPMPYSEVFRALYDIRDFAQLRDCCHDFFALLEDSISQKQYSFKAQMVCKYIEEHYSEKDLGAQKICEHFLFSKSYLSKLFRDEIGSSIPDFIHDVRIRSVKDMLENSEASIQEICESVGYTNRNTLHRAFRNRLGMSPADYRRSRTLEA